MSEAFVAVVALLTIVAVLTRPRGINEGIWALGGGLLLAGTGRLSLDSVGDVLRDLTGVLIFLIGLFWVTLAARRAGLFERAAHSVVTVSGGSGPWLMLAIFAFGTLTTALLSNDATVVLVTPVVLSACLRLRIAPLPYLFACSFVADTASSLLPVSNPINLLYAERFDITFGSHLLLLGLPTIVAVIVNAGVFLLLFRSQLRPGYDLAAVHDWQIAPMTTADQSIVAGLVLVGIGYIVAGLVGIQPSLVTFAGGVVLAAIAMAGSRVVPADLVQVQPPSLYAFVIGLALVVKAADVNGLLDTLGSAVSRANDAGGLSGLLAITFGTALGTNIVNNWTMALAVTGPLARSDAGDLFVAGSMLGADIGPNLSVVGSLATLIWLTEVRRGGLAVSGRTYLRLGLLTTIPTILAATITLYLVGRYA
ncbi:MAG TPA: ArsB/NhaD family transporter [Thermomicrobiales bacterium]|nr:ArsB/NhaD family transporter [Thermomicrobiales bacterium]